MPYLRFTFGTPDAAEFDRILNLRFGAITDFQPAFEDVAEIVYDEIGENFAGEGVNIGGWSPLSPGYAVRKAREFKAGLIPFNTILKRTGALSESLSGKTATGAVFNVSDTGFEIGTTVPYAAAHQYGTKNMPARPPVALSDAGRTRIVKAFQKFAVETVRKGPKLF